MYCRLYDVPQYMNVIKLLQSFGSGPLVLRVGGGSTDKLVTVPDPHVWEALSNLHKATGMKFILGLNFFRNNVTLARAQMDAATASLPPGSIMSFEIGNEVCDIASFHSSRYSVSCRRDDKPIATAVYIITQLRAQPLARCPKQLVTAQAKLLLPCKLTATNMQHLTSHQHCVSTNLSCSRTTTPTKPAHTGTAPPTS